MTAYVLKDLLRVRHLREQMASDAVVKAKVKVLEAEEDVKQAEKELEDYLKWQKEEEERLFQKVIKKKVKRMNITELRQAIAKIRNKIDDYKKAVEDAKEALRKREEELVAARAYHFEMIRNVEKLEDHKSMWMEEQNKENERLADLELEEVAKAKQYD